MKEVGRLNGGLMNEFVFTVKKFTPTMIRIIKYCKCKHPQFGKMTKRCLTCGGFKKSKPCRNSKKPKR